MLSEYTVSYSNNVQFTDSCAGACSENSVVNVKIRVVNDSKEIAVILYFNTIAVLESLIL